MLLLTGPAGSGKTSYVLDQVRAALRRGAGDARLLVPTATMAQHLQNQLAREAFVLRPGLIQTLSHFVEPWAEDLPQISQPAFYLLVEEAARRARRAEFTRVVQMPGFCASLARTMEEFSSAGIDAARLVQQLPEAPLAEAFLAVYQEVDRELERRKLFMRSTRLSRVAARIAAQGLNDIRTLWLDGFYALPDPELAVIDAMRAHADLTVTLPLAAITESTRARLLAMGFTERTCEARRARPSTELFTAPSIERETAEIARRILEQAGAGRAFREIGIIVRNQRAYDPVLHATLERFGIPARFYFDAQLTEHGVARFLCGAVDAVLGGWDWEQTLAVMRLAAPLDRFDFAVRERLPGRGLAGLKELARGDREVLRLLEGFDALRDPRGLRFLFRPPRPGDGDTHDLAAMWRGQAAVLDAFDAAIEEAERWLGRPAPLPELWPGVKSILRLTPLRLKDQRRDVVHVLDVYEARQWELPVVFVCGMVEGQFPRYAPQNPFFPQADTATEEEFLFDVAITRATSALVLSYPRFDVRGEENLPSLFLERLDLEPGSAALVLPEAPEPRSPRPPSVLRSADLLEKLAIRHAVMKPTALESFVQCPFQFFGRHSLQLDPPPPRPEERLGARLQGTIVHSVLAEWQRTREPIEPLFERVFERLAEQENIPRGYRTESLRQQMLADLRRFVDDGQRPPGRDTSAEQDFEFAVGDGLRVRGRIDRLDRTAPGDAVVIDYKYSKKARELVKDPNRLQGPLYLLAVEKALGLRAAGMYYCGLRGAVKYAGWGPGEFSAAWLEAAAETVVEKAREIRAGRVAPAPADTTQCRYCDFRDVCRVEAEAQVAAGEGE